MSLIIAGHDRDCKGELKKMKKIRRHIFFSGMVQGVGFRYRSYYAAKQLGLTGWVRNLMDGRVEMEVQGEDYAIREMIDQIGSGWSVSIDQMESWEVPLEEEREFRIRN